jgi:hypothetical protein
VIDSVGALLPLQVSARAAPVRAFEGDTHPADASAELAISRDYENLAAAVEADPAPKNDERPGARGRRRDRERDVGQLWLAPRPY